MSTSVRAPHRMTVAEFQDWEPPESLAARRWELVDGEPVCMAPPSVDHGAIQGELVRLLGNWLSAHRRDCRAIVTPGVIPRVRSESNERVPDIGVTCGPIQAARTLEAPVVLIEILSPSNEAKTRANVWAYATIPSVQEILLVASTSVAAELYRRAPDGNWPSDSLLVTGDAVVDLTSIGMSFPLRAAYATSSLG